MKADTTMNLLAGVQALPPETRPQDRVPFHEALPRFPKHRAVDLLRQRANDLSNLHARVACRETVKHHPLLHGRERVALFDAVRRRRFVRARHTESKLNPDASPPKVGKALKAYGALTPLSSLPMSRFLTSSPSI